jgi:hypothetical protein
MRLVILLAQSHSMCARACTHSALSFSHACIAIRLISQMSANRCTTSSRQSRRSRSLRDGAMHHRRQERAKDFSVSDDFMTTWPQLMLCYDAFVPLCSRLEAALSDRTLRCTRHGECPCTPIEPAQRSGRESESKHASSVTHCSMILLLVQAYKRIKQRTM